jgi:ribosomal protein S26
MEFICLDGSFKKVSLAKYKPRRKSRSKIQNMIGDTLQEIFPNATIIEEFVIPKTKLSVDFFIPHCMLAIEVQGEQHDKYVKFFHGSRKGFIKQQQRDHVKTLWCDMNDIKKLEIRNNVDKDSLIRLINEFYDD